MATTQQMQVIFDNGGGVTLQTAEFAHHYMDGKQTADDVRALLDGGTTRGWEGDEPEARLEVSQEEIRNGGYRVYGAEEIRQVLAAAEIDCSWANVGDFFGALGVKIV